MAKEEDEDRLNANDDEDKEGADEDDKEDDEDTPPVEGTTGPMMTAGSEPKLIANVCTFELLTNPVDSATATNATSDEAIHIHSELLYGAKLLGSSSNKEEDVPSGESIGDTSSSASIDVMDGGGSYELWR